jgi:hypothetical protein
MSVELINDAGESFGFSNRGWFYVVEFAKAHGWTRLVDDKDFGLSATQASDMANAIDIGIGEGSPDAIAVRVARELTDRLVLPSQSAMFSDEAIVLNAGTILYWKQFVSFARKGGFSIDI